MAEYIYGRNPVREALKEGRKIQVLYVLGEGHGQSFSEIVALAQKAGIRIQWAGRAQLEKLVRHSHHQGVIAEVKDFDYAELEDILALAHRRGEVPLLALLDGIQDPHNLGAIVRSADGAGLHGLIIPRHNAVAVNPTVIKSAAGATSYVKIVQVTNLVQTIEMLKKQNIWIVGADASGEHAYQQQSYCQPTAFVLGSEGKGMRRLVRESCDSWVHIPMFGQINSLNVSVSAALLFFEARSQRQRAIADQKSPD